jgi:hypothetical protein
MKTFEGLVLIRNQVKKNLRTLALYGPAYAGYISRMI